VKAYVLHYIAAFAVVLIGTGVLASVGVFDGTPGITALVPAEPSFQPTETINTSNTSAPTGPPKPEPGPGSW